MTGFSDDARGLIGVIDARRSGIEPAGGFERPASILDWSYALSPFCSELLASRRAEQWEGADESAFDGSLPSAALLEAANDNHRLRLVR